MWRIARLQEKAGFLKQIHAIEPQQRFHTENSIVEVLPIPFYPQGSLLLRCAPSAVRPADYLWYVALPGQDMVALDGSVANIHHLNFTAGLQLTETSLPAYLKFRLYFGKEDGQRRYMTTNPVVTKNGSFICGCQFYEGRNLYAGQFKVSLRGETELVGKTAKTGATQEQMPEFRF